MLTDYSLVFVAVFAASVFFVRKWMRDKNHAGGLRLPPSLPVLPFVGSLPFLRGFENIANFFAEKSQELGPIFTFRAGQKLVLVLNNKEAIEEALVKHSRSFSSRPELFMQKVINPRSKGLIFRDTGPEWKRIHMNSLSVLREFGFGDKNIMEERTTTEVKAMLEFGRKTGGKPFDPKQLFLLVTSNITMNFIFGSRRSYDLGISELTVEVDRYAHLMDMIFDVAPFLKFIPPFKRKIPAIVDCCEKMEGMIQTEVDQSLRGRQTCFVSEYIARVGPGYDREDLAALLRDFVAAGTDTTANTMRWGLVALANHPEIQRKLQQEIDSAIARDRLPTLQDQKNLPYVQATMLELYRWRTLLPLSVARFTKEDSRLMDFFIPSGTLVFPNLHAAHNNPADWKDPKVFRPERFLDKEHNVVGADRVIAFSLGRRSCLGEVLARAEVFLTLASLLQRFTVFPPEGQDRVCDEPVQPLEIVQMPKPYSIRLTERR